MRNNCAEKTEEELHFGIAVPTYMTRPAAVVQ